VSHTSLAKREAAAAKKFVVAGPYPVLDEIRGFGLTVFDPSEGEEVADLLMSGPTVDPYQKRQALVRRHFDLRFLPQVSAELTNQALKLAATPVHQ